MEKIISVIHVAAYTGWLQERRGTCQRDCKRANNRSERRKQRTDGNSIR